MHMSTNIYKKLHHLITDSMSIENDINQSR